MYGNTILVVFYMVFTSRDFNDDKLRAVLFSVKLLELSTQQK